MSTSRRVRNKEKKHSTVSEAKEADDDLNRIWRHIIFTYQVIRKKLKTYL
jgi:hypothetical protein